MARLSSLRRLSLRRRRRRGAHNIRRGSQVLSASIVAGFSVVTPDTLWDIDVSYSSTSTSGSAVVSTLWQLVFDGNVVDTANTPTNTFNVSSPGIYRVRLTIVDADGEEFKGTSIVTIDANATAISITDSNSLAITDSNGLALIGA